MDLTQEENSLEEGKPWYSMTGLRRVLQSGEEGRPRWGKCRKGKYRAGTVV